MEGAGGGVFDCLVSVFADGMVEVEGGAFVADARNRKEVVARGGHEVAPSREPPKPHGSSGRPGDGLRCVCQTFQRKATDGEPMDEVAHFGA
jgi:hypothetical protein